MKLTWLLFFCYFMQADAFFFVLRFVRMFSEAIYPDHPKTLTNGHFKKKTELQNTVKSSFHNVYTLTVYLCHPQDLGDGKH